MKILVASKLNLCYLFKRFGRQIPFVFVNPDNFPDCREMVNLTNIPMIVAFRRGKVISSEYGNKKEIVSKVLSILLG